MRRKATSRSAHLEMEALHTSNKDILYEKVDGI